MFIFQFLPDLAAGLPVLGRRLCPLRVCAGHDEESSRNGSCDVDVEDVLAVELDFPEDKP